MGNEEDGEHLILQLFRYEKLAAANDVKTALNSKGMYGSMIMGCVL